MPPKEVVSNRTLARIKLEKTHINKVIRIRVVRKYVSPVFGKKTIESLEFVFADKEGTRICATVKKSLMQMFYNFLAKRNYYLVKSFTLMDSLKNFPVVEHPLRIMFHGRTIVEEIKPFLKPGSMFKFKRFADIKAINTREDSPMFGSYINLSCHLFSLMLKHFVMFVYIPFVS